MAIGGSEADYREILKRELEARCRKNPNYSLRAFASYLSISPSSLTEVLGGKYGLSRANAEKIAARLGYSKSEKEHFCDLVESRHARSRAKKESAQARLVERRRDPFDRVIEEDHFRSIADWHHMAILELTYLKDFQNKTSWIAKRLGVTPAVAGLAIQRLKRLGLLREVGGRLEACEEFSVAAGMDIPSEAVRGFHRQIIGKAEKALALQSVQSRDFSAVMTAIQREKIPEAKKAIKEFRRRFCQNIGEESSGRDSVYCLSIQFFELTKPEGKES